MRIAFDFQIFMQQPYGGISRYFYHLAKNLSLPSNDVSIIAPIHQNNYIMQLPDGLVDGVFLKKFLPKTSPFIRMYNQLIFRSKVLAFNPDVVHETYFAKRSSSHGSCSKIVTVYDMIHELFPEIFSINDKTTQFKRAAVDRADHVVCISESTRQDLIRLFGTPEHKISVIHLGYDQLDVPNSCVEDVLNSRPYLLFVGYRGGYKNFSGFIKAVASSKKMMKDFDIVAFGGGAFTSQEEALIRELGFGVNQVKQQGGSDFALGKAYRNARAFIYSSLYEGFGLPPLEAMANNCPVISSNTSSMPEVIGDAGVLFDPYKIDSIASAIESVVYSDEIVNQFILSGSDRLKFFSWESCAEKTMNVYKKYQR